MNDFQKYSWDAEENEEIILLRRMKYDDPFTVLRKYSKNFLKKLFLDHIHYFDKKNIAFWSLILEMRDEEIEQKTKNNFRTSCKIWRY
ncbi:MAG: hypothetical protein LWW94_00375 [Candidatus Desulfofervidaceae bacterium]|nr:hypothetical protein [Candidatus Desulfofervidaceae bacterium]